MLFNKLYYFFNKLFFSSKDGNNILMPLHVVTWSIQIIIIKFVCR